MSTNITFLSITGQKTPASLDLEGMSVGDLVAKARDLLSFDDDNGKFMCVLVANGKVLDDPSRPAASVVSEGAKIVFMRKRARPAAAAAASPSPVAAPGPVSPASAATPAAAAATPAAAAAPATPSTPAAVAASPASSSASATAPGSSSSAPPADVVPGLDMRPMGSGDTIVDYIATNPEAMQAFISQLRNPPADLPGVQAMAPGMRLMASFLESNPNAMEEAFQRPPSGNGGGLASLVDPFDGTVNGQGPFFDSYVRGTALAMLRELILEARTGTIDMRVGGDNQDVPSSSTRPPAPVRVRLTAEDEAAVGRLVDLGFPRAAAAEAYLACDKNEEAAANFLLNEMEE